MPTTLEETSQDSAAMDSIAQKAKPEPKHDARWYLDQDPTLYPEAVAHLLMPKRRRTVVTPQTFASIRAACDKR